MARPARLWQRLQISLPVGQQFPVRKSSDRSPELPQRSRASPHSETENEKRPPAHSAPALKSRHPPPLPFAVFRKTRILQAHDLLFDQLKNNPADRELRQLVFEPFADVQIG